MSTESMDIVQSEWAPWTLSRVPMGSMDSVDILQTGFELLQYAGSYH